MRHAKKTFKVGRNTSHRRCLVANMLKCLIDQGQIETSVAKAKYLRAQADRLITLAKKNDLASKRLVKGRLMIRYNSLTPKEARAAKNGNTSAYNADRKIIDKLFNELGPKYKERNGGYTRALKTGTRIGDNGPRCLLQFV